MFFIILGSDNNKVFLDILDVYKQTFSAVFHWMKSVRVPS